MHGRHFAWLILMVSASVFGADTFAPEPASGPPALIAQYPSDGKPAAAIGKLTIEGVGEITFLANRSQGRLVITAKAADGSQLGRAESIVGLGDTPIYVRSAKGLYKIIIRWKT